jgi:zinc transport system permease protein|tara:strand:+ start:18 stop:818 length:801 start_codon:yes stop_codon:yes gene_type:complete
MILDDFFTRALIAGIGVAIVAGPLGCLVIWRRLAYFGDTLSHSALLGVAIAYVFDLNISIAVFLLSGIVALILLDLQKRTRLPGDALLGLLSHASLAIGLVFISFLSFIRFDLMGLLFGDILSVSRTDIYAIWVGGFVILGILYFIWQSIFAATVNHDLASAEGLKPHIANLIFTLLLAGVIAISIKMIGVLLITGLLLIPAAMARNLSNNPKQMVLFSILGGVLSVIVGLFASLELNSPSGPSILVAAFVLFIISLLIMKVRNIS